MKKPFSLLLISLFHTWSCKRKKNTSLYFLLLENKFELNQTEKAGFGKTSTPILYIRYFDIDKVNGRFELIGNLSSKQNIQQK